jgi:hypothetical protein
MLGLSMVINFNVGTLHFLDPTPCTVDSTYFYIDLCFVIFSCSLLYQAENKLVIYKTPRQTSRSPKANQ